MAIRLVESNNIIILIDEDYMDNEDDNIFEAQKELLKKLQDYDLAVVPSIWMETGPLTILEAFAAGLPVAGSNLGGIRELLNDQAGTFLLPSDPLAWKNLFLNINTITESRAINEKIPNDIHADGT